MSPPRKSHGQQKQRQKRKLAPASGGQKSSQEQTPLDLADRAASLGTLLLLPEECEALRQRLPRGVSLCLVGSTEEASHRNSRSASHGRGEKKLPGMKEVPSSASCGGKNSRSSSHGRGENKLTGIEELPTSASSGDKRKADSETPDSSYSEGQSTAKKTRQAATARKSLQEAEQSVPADEAKKTFTEEEKMVLKIKIDKLNDLDRIEGVIAYLNVGQGSESEDITLDLDSVPATRKQGLLSLVDEELRAARSEAEAAEAAEAAENDVELALKEQAESRLDAQKGLAVALAGSKAVMLNATEKTEVRTGFNDSMLDNAMDILALVNEFSTWM
eukprot:TRINITY_DN20684_c0_g1_i1.p1 TRINITY_DN20684_c0_g1~~TRINITY_DN20684_c0_g1_i1.p1  ORF type:complete len:332 (+),score=76.76 TRINITY_DN20684_c0_g1_i1:30-1025(+)